MFGGTPSSRQPEKKKPDTQPKNQKEFCDELFKPHRVKTIWY
jgi:hypothetical protein